MPPELGGPPVWFIVIAIISFAWVMYATRTPAEETHGTLDDVHDLAHEAVFEDVERATQLDVAGVEATPAAARTVTGISALGGCDCPFHRSCRELHAQGFTYLDGHWIAVN